MGLSSAAGNHAKGRVARILCAGMMMLALAGCDDGQDWHATNLTGAFPPLHFSMTRADDGKQVTEADYRGEAVLLYFGYTFCPDVCPTTLSHISNILDRMGKSADDVRVLFVTVDPNRDTLPDLKRYADAFAPQVDALRGTPNELAALAKRYRVAYTVRPAKDDSEYEVSHGSAVYVFDGEGRIRLLFSSLSRAQPDMDGMTADLERLTREDSGGGWLSRIAAWF
ncbi:SCO family protein [Parvibaculum sp.]|uniref:SCO family protein n=1 Tax=Parvibaculum sp. TaxID=2024848 RepID=UPI0025DE3392|nr:SCO family protein [Parvibaculum sp.]